MMIQFLTPLAFLALASLAIPIALHFLNRKEGKRILVGSLKLIEAADSKRFKSLKLNELLLLCLRIALLCLFVALLSQPVLRQLAPSTPPMPGWVLIDPRFASQPVDPQASAQIDSLREAGFEMRALTVDLPQISDLQAAASHSPGRQPWSLLNEADQLLPESAALHIFAPTLLSELRGKRPAFSRIVNWHPVQIEERSRRGVAARAIGTDSLLITIAESTPQRTTASQQMIARPQQAGPVAGIETVTLLYQPATDSAHAALLQTDASGQLEKIAIEAAPPTRNVLLVHDSARSADARYFDAALRATAQHSHAGIELKQQTTDAFTATPPNLNMLIWLSARPAPEPASTGSRKTLIILSDAESDKLININAQVDFLGDQFDEPVQLFRLSAQSPAAGEALWQAHDGEAILIENRQHHLRHLQFRSRFHPAWSSLVLQPVFPEWIRHLLSFSPDTDRPFFDAVDVREASVQQALPRLQREARDVAAPLSQTRDLHTPLWLVLAALFVVERLLSERRAA